MIETSGIATGSRSRGLSSWAISVVIAAVGGSVACVAVAAIAHAAGASDGFKPLHVGTYVPLVIIATIVGAIGWNLVLHRSRDPRRLLSRLVPAVLVVSFVPDVVVGVSDSMPHTTWGAVAALMIMHVLVAAILVAAFARYLGVSAPANSR